MKKLYDRLIKEMGLQGCMDSDFIKTVAKITYSSKEIKDEEWEQLYKANQSQDFFELLAKTKETPLYILEDIANNIYLDRIVKLKAYNSADEMVLEALAEREDLKENTYKKIFDSYSIGKLSDRIRNHFHSEEYQEPLFSEAFTEYIVKNILPDKSSLFLFAVYCKNEELLQPFLEYENENPNIAFAVTNNIYVSEGLRNAAYEIQKYDPITEIKNKTDLVKNISIDVLLNSLEPINTTATAKTMRLLRNFVIDNSLNEQQLAIILSGLTQTYKNISKEEAKILGAYIENFIDCVLSKNASENICRISYELVKTAIPNMTDFVPFKFLCLPNMPRDIVELHVNEFIQCLGTKSWPKDISFTDIQNSITAFSENYNNINISTELKEYFIEKLLEMDSIATNTTLSTNKDIPLKYIEQIIETQKDKMTKEDILKIDRSGTPFTSELPFDYAKINKEFRDIETLNMAETFVLYFNSARLYPSSFRMSSFIVPHLTDEEYEKVRQRTIDFRTKLTVRKIRDGFDDFKRMLLMRTARHNQKIECGCFDYDENRDVYSLTKPEIVRTYDEQHYMDTLKELNEDELKQLYKEILQNNFGTYKNNKGEKTVLLPIDTALKIEGYAKLFKALKSTCRNKAISLKPISRTPSRTIYNNTER